MENNYNTILNQEKINELQNTTEKILDNAKKRLNSVSKAISNDLGQFIISSEKKLNFHPDVPIVPLENGEFGNFTKSYNKNVLVSHVKPSVGKLTSDYDKPVIPTDIAGENKYFRKD